MPSNARDIITNALVDLGVLAEAQTADGDMGVIGLKRLNNLVSSLRTQTGAVIAVQRTIFPLVADKQTYTIGLGGDFNVPRPQKVHGAALWLAGLASSAAVTSITWSAYTATVTQTAHGYAVGDEVFITGANEIAYNGLQTVQTVPTADTYTYTVNGIPDTPATGTITAAPVDGQPVEIAVPVITDSAYQFTAIKNLPNAQFTRLYYNTTFPFGTIVLWPRIDTAANQLILYLPNVFSGFADLDTDYDWPTVDGYAEMLEYNLAKRLRIVYPLADPRMDIEAMARESLGYVKRANNKLVDVPTDASLLTWNRRAGYNINSDQGG